MNDRERATKYCIERLHAGIWGDRYLYRKLLKVDSVDALFTLMKKFSLTANIKAADLDYIYRVEVPKVIAKGYRKVYFFSKRSKDERFVTQITPCNNT